MKNLLIIAFLMLSLAACDQGEKSKEVESEKATTNKEQEQPQEVVTTNTDSIDHKLLQEQPIIINPDQMKPSTEGERTILEVNPEYEMKAAAKAYNQGIGLYQNGDLNGALVKFKTALDKKPDDSRINHYIGRIYYDMGQKDLAISYYEDAVKYDVGDSVSILGIGQIHFDKGDYENAMKFYNIAIDEAPAYGLAYYNRGTLLGMQKNYHQALADLSKSIEYDPTNGNAFVNRGLAHFYLKSINAACADWQQAADMGMPKGAEAIELYCK